MSEDICKHEFGEESCIGFGLKTRAGHLEVRCELCDEMVEVPADEVIHLPWAKLVLEKWKEEDWNTE